MTGLSLRMNTWRFELNPETMQGVESKSKNRVAQDVLVRCDTLRRWFVHAIHSVSMVAIERIHH